jgi:hypothetical protein
VTNIQQLASSADRWLSQLPDKFFDMILVDERHHNVADSWRKVFARFPEAKVVSLTAIPFRSDGEPLEGIPIYRHSPLRPPCPVAGADGVSSIPGDHSISMNWASCRHFSSKRAQTVPPSSMME